MGKIIFFLLFVLLFFLESGYCELSSKYNNHMVNIRHAKKKDHANRDDRFYSRTYSYEYDDYWMSSTEDTTAFETTTDYSYTSDIQETTTEDLDYMTSISETTVDESSIYDVKEDVVTKFLRIVESQHELGENCTAGTDLNLGEGVVDRYAQERFRIEAEVAVNRANFLTRLWKYAGRDVMNSEYLLHASIFSMVEFNQNIFAAGNCYDKYQYKDYVLFCPYAHRLPGGQILAKNLALEYKYLGNNSEWFYQARKNAEKVINKKKIYSYGYHTYTWNESTHTEREADEILTVSYEDGRWSKPYYDCGGGNIWMLTYTVPFFGYRNGTYFFKGTSGIDIDLRRVDIDQCPLPEGEKNLNIFAASDKCKKATTFCVSIKGLGFRRGSYKCVCQKGFYFLNKSADHDYFDGTIIEEEYEKLMLGEESIYNVSGSFECLPCAEGCESCVDSRPCVLALNWVLRTTILILSCLIILCLLIVEFFTWRYRNVKVVRAASPVLLRVIALGAFFVYCTTIVMYPTPTIITCTIKVWLREIGFSITYGALMLKTWRISVIFRVRSARAVKITDIDLMKKLGIIVLVFSTFLCIRTLVAPPLVLTVRTADDLKAYLCETSWWDHWFSIMEALFLAWGIRLCIVVRKAPSEFNESRFISMAIYNEFLLSIFLNVSMFFLHSPANPDLLYIICFCHTQITITLLLCFIFGSKAYMVFKGHGKNANGSSTINIKLSTSKFLSKPAHPSSSQAFPSSSSINISGGVDKMTEQDIQEELQNICKQLETLKDKNSRYGNRKLASKLSSIYDCSVKTMEEISVEEESSSSMAAEKPSEDSYRIEMKNVKKMTNDTNHLRNSSIQDASNKETFLDYNCCSANSKSNNKIKHVSSNSSCIKDYLKRNSIFASDIRNSNKNFENKIEQAQARTIIFNVEDKSQCKQVSL
ncbi:probable G-protein coupled receptor CG31760 [Planococcus citri]|uniref:probable G-protein coupled receptor CG31760 n=1 Tax=Planococcus citri TaxID=170843 RepID=UPI0031F8D4B2